MNAGSTSTGQPVPPPEPDRLRPVYVLAVVFLFGVGANALQYLELLELPVPVVIASALGIGALVLGAIEIERRVRWHRHPQASPGADEPGLGYRYGALTCAAAAACVLIATSGSPSVGSSVTSSDESATPTTSRLRAPPMSAGPLRADRPGDRAAREDVLDAGTAIPSGDYSLPRSLQSCDLDKCSNSAADPIDVSIRCALSSGCIVSTNLSPTPTALIPTADGGKPLAPWSQEVMPVMTSEGRRRTGCPSRSATPLPGWMAGTPAS